MTSNANKFKHFWKEIRKAWYAIPNERSTDSVEISPSKCIAVIQNKGVLAKYSNYFMKLSSYTIACDRYSFAFENKFVTLYNF